LIERLGLLFEQRQIMQRIVNEIGRLVAARMHGDRFIPADDLRPVEMEIEKWRSERPKPVRTGLTLRNLGEGGNADAISSTDCEGKSSRSATADPASAPCRSKPWTARHRCPV